MAARLSPDDCLLLVQSGLLPDALLRQIVTRALRRRSKAPPRARQRLTRAVRRYVSVTGYADPLDAPLRDLVAAALEVAASSGALLRGLLHVWACSRKRLRQVDLAYLRREGPGSLRTVEGLHRATDEVLQQHPEFRRDAAAVMLVWLAKRLPVPEAAAAAQPQAHAAGQSTRTSASAAGSEPASADRQPPFPPSQTVHQTPGAPAAGGASPMPNSSRHEEQHAPYAPAEGTPERAGRAWSARFAALLGELQAVAPDDPTWQDVGWFTEGLRSLRRDAQPTPQQDSLGEALTALATEAQGHLAYFGLPPLDARRADAVPPHRRDALAEEVAWLRRMLEHYHLLRAESSCHLSEDLARRSRLEALESQILQTYERLDAVVGSARPIGEAVRPAESPPAERTSPRAAPARHPEEPDAGAPAAATESVAHEEPTRPPAPAQMARPTVPRQRPRPQGQADEAQAEREGTISGRPPYAPHWEPLDEDQRREPPDGRTGRGGREPAR